MLNKNVKDVELHLNKITVLTAAKQLLTEGSTLTLDTFQKIKEENPRYSEARLSFSSSVGNLVNEIEEFVRNKPPSTSQAARAS